MTVRRGMSLLEVVFAVVLLALIASAVSSATRSAETMLFAISLCTAKISSSSRS